ncbi:hypothetical protein HYY27_02275, partial [bacterium]|nr:hypothetical protein [bacterium]
MFQGLAFKLVVALTILMAVTKGVFSYFSVKEEERHFIQNMILGADQLSQSIAIATWQAMRADCSDRLASLGQLAATVAHEINNPVAGVLNLGTLMQRIVTRDGIPPDRIEEFQSYLGLVVTETSRVGRIVSDLLAFSR